MGAGHNTLAGSLEKRNREKGNQDLHFLHQPVPWEYRSPRLSGACSASVSLFSEPAASRILLQVKVKGVGVGGVAGILDAAGEGADPPG